MDESIFKQNLFKKKLTAIICIVFLLCNSFFLLGCVSPADRKLVKKEAKASFLVLWEQSNSIEGSPGYGMVFDRYPTSPNLASIASVGFLLGSLPGAVAEKWVTYNEAYERANGTLNTILNMENINGFHYHFVNMWTAKRSGGTEVSVIDTALMMGGVIAAGEYFGGSVKEKADKIYERINWNWYTNRNNGKLQYRMGFIPEDAVADGKYIYTFTGSNGNIINAGDPAPSGKKEGDGFSYWWSGYAEQLIMYVLGGGAPKEEYRIPKEMMYSYDRRWGSWNDLPEAISADSPIFFHQYSHAFIDFKNKKDEEGVDWFQNSVNATISAREYIIYWQELFGSFGENSWGLSASDTPSGYKAHRAGISGAGGSVSTTEGTIPIYGALSSIIFTPKESIAALKYYYSQEKLLFGYHYPEDEKYGLVGAYSIKNDGTEWYAKDILGIDKGITSVMLLNYLQKNITSRYFMKNQNIKDGLSHMGIK